MASLDLEYPFAGRWLTRNSPANRVPSATIRRIVAFLRFATR